LTCPTPIGDIPGLKEFIINRRAAVLSQLNLLGWTCPVTSLKEISRKNEMKIFPNPSSSETSISTGKNLHEATVIVYNSFGQQVIRMDNLSGQIIPLRSHSLPGGIYFVCLSEKEILLATAKLVIAK
jgi:hypothetical protein